MKRKHKIVLVTFISICVIIIVANFILCGVNYKKNAQLSYSTNADGLIVSQQPLGDFGFGFGNLKANGCGCVALYNILKMKGQEMPLAEIIRNVELFGAQFFGILGTSPIIIKWFLMSKGFDCSFVTNRANFEQALEKNEFVIYVYYGIKGGHYQLIYDYNKTDKSLKTLNPVGYSNFSDIYEDSRGYSKFMITIK